MIDKWFMSGAICNNVLYWVTEIGGHFMKMNLDSLQVEFIELEYGSKSLELSMSAIIYEEESVLYIMGNRGEFLLKYCVVSGNYKVFQIHQQEQWLNVCASVSKFEDELIILPVLGKKLIKVNVQTGSVKYENILCGAEQEEGERTFFAKYDVIDHIMWCFSRDTSEVVEYNIKSGKKKHLDLPASINEPIDAIKCNDGFYILTRQGSVFRWNISSGREEILFNCPDIEITDSYSRIHFSNHRLWVLPLYGNDIWEFDLEKKQLSRLQEYPKDMKYNTCSSMGKYTYKIYDNNKCYFAMHSGNYILCITNDGEVEWIAAKWPKEEAVEKHLKKKGAFSILESSEESVKAFMIYIIKKEEKEMEVREYGAGSKIWKECKSL